MRTIKFLGLAVALAAVSSAASAQGGRRFDRAATIDDLARVEARRIEQGLSRRQAFRRFVMAQRARGFQRGAAFRGPAGVRGARFAGPRGQRMLMARRMRGMDAMHGMGGMRGAGGMRALRAGRHGGMRNLANATPAQKEFLKSLGAQRQSIRAQVIDGKLTREQARTQLRNWAKEHRPK
jgi:hypothetical protein